MYNDNDIYIVDTHKWKKNPFRLFFCCIKAFRKYDNIIFLTAHNGVKIFVPLFAFLNKIYKKNTIYAVVGGWLATILEKKKRLLKKIKSINYVLVETNGLKKKLTDLGLNNVSILLNFKDIKVIDKKELSFKYKNNYKLCTFSRVMEEKGISDAIESVSKVNKEIGKTAFKLDIYGPVEDNYKDRLNSLLEENKEYVSYCGIANSNESVKIVSKYDLLLFPTRFKTEGLPGTIIDAFASGIPVIYSNWDYCDEFLTDNYNGVKFEMENVDDLSKVLLNFYNKEYDIEKIKQNCLESAKMYEKNNAIKALIDCLR